jgi:DNA polymerase-3 subunit delta
MTEEKPIVYILRGDDREAIEGHIKDFYAKLGQPDIAAMNTTRLEGRTTTLNDLRSAALTAPFLSERRLVIVEDALKPYSGQGKQEIRKELLLFLESAPDTAGIVFVTPDFMKWFKGEWVWDSLNEKNWFIKWALGAGSKALIINCSLPLGNEMILWVRKKVAELGGDIAQLAVTRLVEYVGNNTQRATREIEKLLTYVNFSRPIDDDDVERLTVNDRQSDIFEMVDAIGNRDGKKALDMLHLLLEDNELIPVYSMVIRQFRLIIQAKEILLDGGGEGDVVKNLHLNPYVAHKAVEQSQQFEMVKLEEIYKKLLVMDVENKTGVMPGDVALDVFIAGLTQKDLG